MAADDEDQSRVSSAGFGPQSLHVVQKAAGGRTAAQQRYSEIGRTGLRHWGGFVYEEWLRELQTGRRAAEVFREMSDQDPVIGGILYAIEMLVRQVDWWVEPVSKSTADAAAAEFYEQVLFEDMATSFDDTVSEILSMLTYGWAWFEIVWKQRGGDVRDPTKKSKYTDGRIGVRKLALRAQDALWRWEFDDVDDVEAMTQNPPPDYMMRTIPAEKSLLFRTKIFKNNPEGRSILRNAYRPYYFLKNLQNLEGIGAERDLAGLPVLTPPPGVDLWNESDAVMVASRQKAEQLVSSIRRDEQEGVLLPHGWTLTLLSPGTGGGRRQFDTNSIITRYEQRIATSVLADLILLGQDKVGSYALSSSKEDIFSTSIETYLDGIASVFDSHFAPKLFRLNSFPGVAELPKLKHGPVQRIDLETIGDFLMKLGNSGAPLWPNPEALAKLLELAGLPAPEPEA